MNKYIVKFLADSGIKVINNQIAKADIEKAKQALAAKDKLDKAQAVLVNDMLLKFESLGEEGKQIVASYCYSKATVAGDPSEPEFAAMFKYFDEVYEKGETDLEFPELD